MAHERTARTPTRLSAIVAKPFDSMRKSFENTTSPTPKRGRRGRPRSPYPLKHPLFDAGHDHHYSPRPSMTASTKFPPPMSDSLDSDWVEVEARPRASASTMDVFSDSAPVIARPMNPVLSRPDDTPRQRRTEPSGDGYSSRGPPAEIRSSWTQRFRKHFQQPGRLRKHASTNDLREPRYTSGAGETRRKTRREPDLQRYRQQLAPEFKHTALFSHTRSPIPSAYDDSESDFGHDPPLPEHRLSSHRLLSFNPKWTGDGADLGIFRGHNSLDIPSALSPDFGPGTNTLQLEGLPHPRPPAAPSSHVEPEPPAPPVPPKDWHYGMPLDNSNESGSPPSQLLTPVLPQIMPGPLFDSPEVYFAAKLSSHATLDNLGGRQAPDIPTILSGRTANRLSASLPVFRKATPPRTKIGLHTEENCRRHKEGLVCLRNHLVAAELAKHPSASSTERRCFEWSLRVEPGLAEDQRPEPLSPSPADAEMSLLGLLRSRLKIKDDEANETLTTIPSIPDMVETENETAREAQN
ncbi:hypothetical protein Q8F55_008205 [Vanrija albida]|uniref:Uncharacterized protein n=1 Tax=Vanrija albida TaxID=181172 RepID=A0ABR3PVZ3_9TREE